MKFTVATLLVVFSLVSAEPPRFRNFARQTAPAPTESIPSAPYNPSGWRPAGAQFNLPPRSQPQQLYGAPSPSYGPPPESDVTTTDAATEQYSEAENIQHIPNKKPAKIQAQQDPVFLIVPQRQNLIYTVQQTAPLVAIPETKIARLQALPISREIFTPYVQIYQ